MKLMKSGNSTFHLTPKEIGQLMGIFKNRQQLGLFYNYINKALSSTKVIYIGDLTM